MKFLTSCVGLVVAASAVQVRAACRPECSEVEIAAWLPANEDCPEANATITFTAQPNGPCSVIEDASESQYSVLLTVECDNGTYYGELYPNANCSGTPSASMSDYIWGQCGMFGTEDNEKTATVKTIHCTYNDDDDDDDDDDDNHGDDDDDDNHGDDDDDDNHGDDDDDDNHGNDEHDDNEVDDNKNGAGSYANDDDQM
eukprot:CFRG0811T1